MKRVPVFVWPIAGGDIALLAMMPDRLNETGRLIVTVVITLSMILWIWSFTSKKMRPLYSFVTSYSMTTHGLMLQFRLMG